MCVALKMINNNILVNVPGGLSQYSEGLQAG
jgi:hypothetical protein